MSSQCRPQRSPYRGLAKQLVDDFLVRFGILLGQKRGHLRRSRRQAGQIDIDAAQQCALVRFGQGRQSVFSRAPLR